VKLSGERDGITNDSFKESTGNQAQKQAPRQRRKVFFLAIIKV
jgi:hypothetical protein